MGNIMFGLLALGLLAGAAFAVPADYDLYKKTGGCLRYVGPQISAPYFAFPLEHPDQYEEVSLAQLNYDVNTPQNCHRENGVPICA